MRSAPTWMLVAAALGAPAAAGAQAGAGAVKPFAFAPYVFGTDNIDLRDWIARTGQRYVTLAFYNSRDGQCAGAWAEPEPAVMAQAKTVRAAGGDVILSTGGWNADDLAERCGDPKSLADVYDAVLARFGADHLDLDAEPGDIHDNLRPAVVDRRSAAMRILQDRFAARGRKLHLSFTLGVHPGVGLDPRNFYVLTSARAAGVDIDVVNPMIMDYGPQGPAGTMGERSILALETAQSEVATLFPNLAAPQVWAKMAATAMIGQNDQAAEVFTLDDARQVEAFAEQKGMARLSFWSLNRDNPSCAGQTKAENHCSGVAQPMWGYSQIFGRFATAP